MKRKCKKCRKRKHFSKFTKQGGYRLNICKLCLAKKAKLWRERNPEAYREMLKRNRTPEKIRDWNLRFSFGITLKDWNQLFKKQGKRCAICKRKTPTGKGWSTDHEGPHSKKRNYRKFRVRGILCSNCNTLLGLCHESIRTLKRAIEYLKIK